MNGREKMTIN